MDILLVLEKIITSDWVWILFVLLMVLFLVTKWLAKILLGLIISLLTFLTLFVWTSEDYIEFLVFDKWLSPQTNLHLQTYLTQWDDWRREKG